MSGERNDYLKTISLPNLTNWSVRYLLGFAFNYNYPLVSLGEYLMRSRNLVHLEDDTEYRQVTVKIKKH